MVLSPRKRKQKCAPSQRRESPDKKRRVDIKPRKRSLSLDSFSDSSSEKSVHSNVRYGYDASSSPSPEPKFIHRRSFSIDSVPESPPPGDDFVLDLKVEITSETLQVQIPVPVYHPFSHEIEESRDLDVPGERVPSYSKPRSKPVRILNEFTFYGEDGSYLPFALVAATLQSSTAKRIRGSGIVSRCLEDVDDGDSDISDDGRELMVSLQPLIDFSTEYSGRQMSGVWNVRTVSVATAYGWYILKYPAALYSNFYQPFWLSHYLTYLTIRSVQQNPRITVSEFCRYVDFQGGDDEDALEIMGRGLRRQDFMKDYVIIYIYDQMSSEEFHDMQGSPLFQDIFRCASQFGNNLFARTTGDTSYKDDTSIESRHTHTITMPLVHELAEGLFLKSLLKAGKTLDVNAQQHKLIQEPKAPDILHPDSPTNIEWEKPSKFKGYFNKLYLDGESYEVGDVIMVNPGEDNLSHRARSALEACSRSRENELVNTVWFCRIIRMFKHKSEPTAHVQWYQHGARTILQETAHPYGLFALAECEDIPVDSILGPCVIQHLKPGDEEPHDYHCSFLWDAGNVRFLDQEVIKPTGDPEPGDRPRCACCDYIEKNDLDGSYVTILHSDSHAIIRDVDYHKNDFVYISIKPNHPYLVGQIRRFNIKSSPKDTQVEVTLLGRFDDIARAVGGPNVKQDETRLFMTDQTGGYPLELIEGKCFVGRKETVIAQDLDNFFYADQWAPTLDIRKLEDLTPLKYERIDVCRSCVEATAQERESIQYLKSCNKPLRTMELFAGAGGLSTGLEQSSFIKTKWAVELVSGAAATFQANHPDAVVYNEDTNICLQSAIDAHDGKSCAFLNTVVQDGKQHPMPQRDEVDLITGGFPCQSFSGMNHQRHKNPDDIRSTLVANMLSYVEFYRPRFVLMENVKGLLQYHRQGAATEGDDASSDDDDGDNVIKMSIVKFVLRALLRLGYQTHFRVLQAADYGSPQRRERVIFWAAQHSELLPDFPLPTHVTPNYKNHTISLPTHDKLDPVQRSELNCAPFRALVVADAISDLPGFDWKNPHVLCPERDSEAEEVSRRRRLYAERSAVSNLKGGRTLVGFTEPVSYAVSPRTRYQRMLRGGNREVTLHCSRTFIAQVVERVWNICSDHVTGPHGTFQRIIVISSTLDEADGLLLWIDYPRELWTQALMKASESEAKLHTKWRSHFTRLKWKEPFNTALTMCRPFSKGSKVLHPKQKRILTARECARSQGFPDSYEFVQTGDPNNPTAWGKLLGDIHKQIGNAVPVPLAHALGKSLGKALIRKWSQEKSIHDDAPSC